MSHPPFIIDFESLPVGGELPADVLAVMRFGESGGIQAAGLLDFQTGLAALDPAVPAEVWRVRGPVETGSSEGIAWAESGPHLFGSIVLDETPGDDFADFVQAAYLRILRFLREGRHPVILRAWNYFPDIHASGDGLDRYQAFCVGRYRAFMEAGYQEGFLPAATVIGNDVPGLRIAFLASREPGEQIENPRQVSAFRYPQEYGPQSPSFSRATLGDGQLFVSGTASIVGHESLHGGDVLAQTDEILVNLQAVLDAARERAPIAARTPADLDLLRVYVRRPEDADAVRRHLAGRLGGRPRTVVLRGDICREELLVEIETMCG